ncbi:MAG: hypothetical protein ABI461_23615 [Polyangiaceae bacterium]
MNTQRWSVVGSAFVLCLVYANVASADDADKTKDEPTTASASVDVNGASAEKTAEGEPNAEGEEAEEKEPKLNLTIDGVFGFGDVPALNPSPPTTLGTLSTHSLENTHVASDSYILGFGYRIAKDLTIGARIPIVHASFGPEGLQNQRGATTIGNLEIWAAYEKKLTKKLAIIPELGIALPTAAGDELPEGKDVSEDPTKSYDNNAADRFSALQAASASRGLEESALFESKRLGIIPKIELEYKTKKLTIAPYVKLENMIATSSSLEKGYLGEIVPGFLASYSVVKWLDVGLRGWASIAFDKENHDNNALIVVEPQLRAHIGPIHPVVGLLLPIFPTAAPGNTYNPPQPYEPVFDPRFLALRLALTGSF